VRHKGQNDRQYGSRWDANDMDRHQIPQRESAERVERLRALMPERGLDAVLLGTGTNLKYFSGYPSPARSGSRPFFLLLPLYGDPIFVVQSGRKAEALRFSWIKDVRDYAELSRVPIDVLRDALRERGVLGKRLGMELGFEQSLDVPYQEFCRLKENLAGTALEDASDMLWRLRMIKTPNEIACLRRACQILGHAYEEAFGAAREGTTERQIACSLRNSFDKSEADEGFILITSGPGNYGLTTKAPASRPIRRGDMVWVDAGCTVGGYNSDFSRAAVVGEPSPEQLRAQEAIRQITWAAIEQIRPGLKASELARFCNAKLERLGFAFDLSISGLASRVGHGLGMDVTEPPHIAEYDHTVLEAGMVIAMEPGVATEYGTFHVEENIVVEPEGHQVLSEAQRTLWRIAPD
jgi:Xaa-Pro aminopeptidase